MKEPGALRAARFDTHLLPQGTRAEVLDPWRAELQRTGRVPATTGWASPVGGSSPRTRSATGRPSETRSATRCRCTSGSSARRRTLTFGKRGAGPIPQTWIVGDADHCVAELQAFIDEYGITDIGMAGLPPGMRPDEMNPSLERYARDVAPRLRARLAGAAVSHGQEKNDHHRRGDRHHGRGAGRFRRGRHPDRGRRDPAVGPSLDGGGAEVIDGAGMIALPGIIDAHTCLWQTVLRGYVPDLWPGAYYSALLPLRSRFTAEDNFNAAYVGGFEMLSYGTTTVVDYCHDIRSPVMRPPRSRR